MREALIAAYKEKGEKLAEEVARYSLRQTDDGLYCRQQHVYVPTPSLRRRCLQEIHDAPYSGHKGVNKTLAAVQRLYWWPGMKAAVTNYVTTCASCQRNKVQGKKPIGLLQPLEVPAAQWAEVTMDFITGLPCTAAGHDAIMVFCDRLTKMVHFAACTTTIDAAGAAKLFRDRVVAAHGLPVSIISDRDARFTSDFWKALVGLLGIQHKMSSAFHPQTDGQTERVNRVLEEYLSKSLPG
jgi:transposase InsO family protein